MLRRTPGWGRRVRAGRRRRGRGRALRLIHARNLRSPIAPGSHAGSSHPSLQGSRRSERCSAARQGNPPLRSPPRGSSRRRFPLSPPRRGAPGRPRAFSFVPPPSLRISPPGLARGADLVCSSLVGLVGGATGCGWVPASVGISASSLERASSAVGRSSGSLARQSRIKPCSPSPTSAPSWRGDTGAFGNVLARHLYRGCAGEGRLSSGRLVERHPERVHVALWRYFLPLKLFRRGVQGGPRK